MVSHGHWPPPADERSAGPRGTLAVLESRDLRLVAAGSVVSYCGNWMQGVALAVTVYEVSHADVVVGAVMSTQFLGIVVLAPLAGAAADRFAVTPLLIVVQLAGAAVAALLAVLVAVGAGGLPALAGCAAALGATTAFTGPASGVLLTRLVRPQDLPTVLALDGVAVNAARGAAAAVAAPLLLYAGPAWVFAANGASYVIFAATLLPVRPRPVTVEAGESHDRRPASGGMRAVLAEPAVPVLLAMLAVAALAVEPVGVLGPGLAAGVLNRPAAVSGYLIAALGVGALLGAVLLPRLARRYPPRRLVAMSLILLAVGVLALAAAPNLPVAVAVVVLAGAGYLAAHTTTTAALLTAVPPERRGAALAVRGVAFHGCRPLAALLAGGLASLVGVRVALVLLALPAAAVLAGLGRFPTQPRRGERS